MCTTYRFFFIKLGMIKNVYIDNFTSYTKYVGIKLYNFLLFKFIIVKTNN